MKAREYFDKYIDRIIAEAGTEKEQSGALYELLMDFMNEVKEIAKARHAQSNRAAMAIFRELNQKWNALCNICVKVKGYSVLNRDGFKAFITKEIPETKDKW